MKALGRQIRNFDWQEWLRHCEAVMKSGNWAKFDKNLSLHAKLLASWPKILVEASLWGKYWGIGMTEHDAKWNMGHWPGRNWLGHILMELHHEFGKKKSGYKNCCRVVVHHHYPNMKQVTSWVCQFESGARPSTMQSVLAAVQNEVLLFIGWEQTVHSDSRSCSWESGLDHLKRALELKQTPVLLCLDLSSMDISQLVYKGGSDFVSVAAAQSNANEWRGAKLEERSKRKQLHPEKFHDLNDVDISRLEYKGGMDFCLSCSSFKQRRWTRWCTIAETQQMQAAASKKVRPMETTVFEGFPVLTLEEDEFLVCRKC